MSTLILSRRLPPRQLRHWPHQPVGNCNVAPSSLVVQQNGDNAPRIWPHAALAIALAIGLHAALAAWLMADHPQAPEPTPPMPITVQWYRRPWRRRLHNRRRPSQRPSQRLSQHRSRLRQLPSPRHPSPNLPSCPSPRRSPEPQRANLSPNLLPRHLPSRRPHRHLLQRQRQDLHQRHHRPPPRR